MRAVQVGNTSIKYKVRRSSKAKKLIINVTPGSVEVVAPKDTTDEVIDELAHRRRRWIFTKVDEIEEAAGKLLKTQPSRFATGAKIPYRGRNMRLYVQESKGDLIRVTYNNGFFVETPPGKKVTDGEIKKALEKWMQQQLKRDCDIFVRRYASKLGIEPRNLRVKNQKHLWGSLGKDNIININWHLVFAHKSVTEYVVAHEMCHLKHRTHSPAFWKLLRSVFNQTDDCKTWLDKNTDVWEMGV